MESISKFHRKFLVHCVHSLQLLSLPLIGLVKVGVPVPVPVQIQMLVLSVNHGVNRLSDAQLPIPFCHKIVSVNINSCIYPTNYQLFFTITMSYFIPSQLLSITHNLATTYVLWPYTVIHSPNSIIHCHAVSLLMI